VIVSDGDRVLQVVAQRNGTVHVAVEDTGPGIPVEMRERLFRPFVSQTGGGTGLGLAIAKELSVALGGHIDLRSEVGRGSRFELVLPAR
jgi:signal transduction histidine kinase